MITLSANKKRSDYNAPKRSKYHRKRIIKLKRMRKKNCEYLSGESLCVDGAHIITLIPLSMFG